MEVGKEDTKNLVNQFWKGNSYKNIVANILIKEKAQTVNNKRKPNSWFTKKIENSQKELLTEGKKKNRTSFKQTRTRKLRKNLETKIIFIEV